MINASMKVLIDMDLIEIGIGIVIGIVIVIGIAIGIVIGIEIGMIVIMIKPDLEEEVVEAQDQ